MPALVSVIMPCYNDGKYIQKAIESLERQTYSNYELIVIDDGSDDIETQKIIYGLKKRNNILILHTNHLRPAGARNYGIEHAKGKYILPLDSDDMIEPTYIEKAVEILERRPLVGVVYCQADLFGEAKGKWNLPDYSREQLLLDNIVFVTAMFYKKDWELVGGFKTNMDAGMEDYDFWLSILELGREIYQIPEILFHYRIKSVSRTTMFQDNSLQVQKIYRRIFENHKRFYKENYDVVIPVLRDALIEQIFLRKRLEKQLEYVKKIKQIPVLGWILKRLLKNKEI